MTFLSFADLRVRGIKYSRCQIWRRVKAGTFPPPVKLSASRNVWLERDIDAWMAALVAERDEGLPGAAQSTAVPL